MEYLYLKISVIIITFLFFLRLFFAYSSKKLTIKGYDIVGKPNSEYKLFCKIQTSNVLGFDKADERVDFIYNGKVIGSGISDPNGMIEIEYKFQDYGVYRIDLKLISKKYSAPAGKIVAGIFPPDKPIIICDIDHTLCETNLFLFLLNFDDRIKEVKYSPKSLTHIAEKYNIIYVTHRDTSFIYKTKYWLDLKGYPDGPVFFCNYGLEPFSNETYKQNTVKRLKSQFDNIVAGVGDKVGDAFAYYANGLKAIILTEKKNRHIHPHLLQAEDWHKIENYLMKLEV